MQIAGSVLSVTALIILLLPVKERKKPEAESEEIFEEKKEHLNDYEDYDNKKDNEILTDL